MYLTLNQQKKSIESLLDERLKIALRKDAELREKYPDEVKDYNPDIHGMFFKVGENPDALYYRGMVDMITGGLGVFIKTTELGNHVLIYPDYLKAECNRCENEGSKLCKKCIYNSESLWLDTNYEKHKNSYFKTVLNDGSVWDESENEIDI